MSLSQPCQISGAWSLISRRSGDRRDIIKAWQAQECRSVPGQSHGGGGLASGRRGTAATSVSLGTRAVPFAFSRSFECA
jgi:hypothetical protein